MKFSLTLIALLFSLTSFAQTEVKLANGHLAYYGEKFFKEILPSANVDQEELFDILNSKHSQVKGSYDSISSQCGSNCYSHNSVGYTQARIIMFGELDKQEDRDGNYVLDVYCGKKFHFRDARQASNMHTEVNIEHTWPQSKFSGKFDKNMQKSDMHHLFLTDSDANNRRGNHEFGDTTGVFDELNVDDCEISQLAHIKGDIKFTPPKAHRGNVARALFYFSVRYKLQINRDQEATIRKWNKEDPIDDAERARHEQVAKYQKVRNPFIDYPELADKILDF